MEKVVEDMFNRKKDGYFHCKTCSKKLFTKIIFEKHLKTEHSTTLKIEKDTEANNNNPIDYQDCKPHISKNQLRPYPCTLCEKYFKVKALVTQHISMVHNKLKPYQCLQCKRSFGSKLILQVHINGFHKKLKPFECQECLGKFSHKQALNNHTSRCRKVNPLKDETLVENIF